MASGWAKDDAVQEQIDSDIDDAVSRVRSQLHTGNSLTHCEQCHEPIPPARQTAVPGVRWCIQCQQDNDRQTLSTAYNRRGSKDSQLR
ncbi:DksA/TraR family C4-type zinc finger protein [Shewanella sp. GXUN23E]|uniref:DksA/TraR family C4-type zinc finger protein n=1 Tax=Shewanella sp. GXUN23E TaxID=3422498 RepID=UPI003D7C6863